jgi:hypothetical protein
MSVQLGVPESKILVTARYSGLAGRELMSIDGRRYLDEGRRARQDQIDVATTVEAQLIEDGLPEIVSSFLRPLYHLFDLFDPPPQMFSEEIRRLREGNF